MSFEYKTLSFDKKAGFFKQQLDSELLQQQLNKYGQSGWEVVSSTNTGSQMRPFLLVILKREK